MPPLAAKIPVIDRERRLTVKDKIELPRIYLGWITSPIFKPGDAEGAVAAEILGGGTASRLYKRLVYEQQIAQSVVATQYSLILGSVFELTVTARPGHTAESWSARLYAELARSVVPVRRRPRSSAARNSLETPWSGARDLGGFGGVADRLNRYHHFRKDPGYLPKDARGIARSRCLVKRSPRSNCARTRAPWSTRIPGDQESGRAGPDPAPVTAKPGEGLSR